MMDACKSNDVCHVDVKWRKETVVDGAVLDVEEFTLGGDYGGRGPRRGPVPRGYLGNKVSG